MLNLLNLLKQKQFTMETLKYKTTLKCDGCVAAVKPGLDRMEGLKNWSVDLNSPDRTLTALVETSDLSEKIVETFERAGYKAWI